MSIIRKTITLPEGLDRWVKTRTAQGDYGNDSEYIRDLIRRDREQRDARAELAAMIEEAEDSGISEQTAEEIWAEAETEYQAERA